MRRLGCILLCAFALAVAAGCKTPPTVRHYVLEPRAEAQAEGDGLLVGVMPFTVDAPYDQTRIAYRVGENSPEIAFYEYHRWAAPLSAMLPRLAAAAYGDVAGVGRIEPYRSGERYDLRLAGRVVRLEEVDDAGGQHASVELVLTLLDTDGSTLWSAPAGARGSTSAETVPAVVDRMREAIEQALRERRAEVARVIGAVRQTGSDE